MPKITKNWLGAFFDRGIDFENRRIYLLDELSDDFVKTGIHGMHLLESASTDPITIYVGTYGGDVYDMFLVFDLIRASKCHIKTIGLGKVMSAGILLMASGDEKLCYSNTHFMVHEFSWSKPVREKFGEHRQDVKHTDAMQKRWAECMAAQTTTSARRWRDMLKPPDNYFDAQEAQRLGIVEKILDETGE